MDEDIIAVSNLVNGIDWYSLSGLKFLSTTKLPAGATFHPLSGLTFTGDGGSILLGGANGGAHILSRDNSAECLQNTGMSLLLH